MFEAAEVGNKVGKKKYSEEVPRVREALLRVQKELAAAPFSVVVLVGGVEGAGKSAAVNLLLEWMDARGIETRAIGEPTDEERERPPMWRFWRLLPAHGRMAIFLGSWYSAPIVDRVFNRIRPHELDHAMDRVVDFERMLNDEGTLLVKLWMHLSKKTQRRRLRALEKDPQQSWRVAPLDWKYFKRYDEFRRVCETALRRTSTGYAPWTIIEARDARYRNLMVATTLLGAIERRLGELAQAAVRAPEIRKELGASTKLGSANLINQLDLTRSLERKDYERQLLAHQAELALLSRRLYAEKRSLILVFEGADAAGKGGAIRRLIQAMDARNYQLSSVSAPTDEERAHPYLWRFWRNLPRLGRVTIYDRSWYGRVLVERVEGFCAPDDWRRGYAEINAFEEQLVDSGTVVLKFWLAIGREEQLRRFEHREKTPYKQYKITEEDWRNRKKWDDYEEAACEMIERTSTATAPWVLVESENKEYARVKVIKTVVDYLKRALG